MAVSLKAKAQTDADPVLFFQVGITLVHSAFLI